MAKNSWTQIALTPLSGQLDTRSRPPELSAGAFRYKLNLAINRTGSLCVRPGHAALNFGLRSDSPAATPNWDFHRRDALLPREAINFLFEGVTPTGVHRLYAGSPSHMSVLDPNTSEWTHIGDAAYPGVRWRAAALEDYILFTNNEQAGIKLHGVSGVTWGAPITWTSGFQASRARIAITFSDVVMLMNVDSGGTTYSSRVQWSDYKNAASFQIGGASIGGFQDLDYGDEILAAAEMMGALYIFTASAIWRCVANITATSVFSFQKIYSEPKNKSGCLRYLNTLVTTGRELYWGSNDSIWTFNPYIAAPESPEWLLKGSGAFYSSTNADRMDNTCCEAIIGEYHPLTKEIWYSYPQGSNAASTCLNNRCLVLNVEFKTMDLVDVGYTAFVNHSRPVIASQACNSVQVFIGASPTDYCLKSIGDVFWRESVALSSGGKTAEISDAAYTITQTGYHARIVGLCPFGYPNQSKTVRELLLDSEIASNTLVDQNLLTLRIGNSFAIQDPMSEGEFCAVMWHDQESLALECPDPKTIAAMLAAGENPSDPLAWDIYEQGNRLYYDLKVTAADGSAPMQHDAAFSAFRFDVLMG